MAKDQRESCLQGLGCIDTEGRYVTATQTDTRRHHQRHRYRQRRYRPHRLRNKKQTKINM